MDSEALYDILEREIVPRFYARDTDGLPRQWIWRMKASLAKLCPFFNMRRALMQYVMSSIHRRTAATLP